MQNTVEMKTKLFLAVSLVLSFGLWAKAQDTLTVMQYNLLYYGNYASGYASCFETNNNTQLKDECIRTIVDYVKPDILTVNEFGATDALHADFLRHNLNINGADWWESDNRINYANSNIINHIFYDSRKMGLKRHVALRTSPRDTDVYELYMRTPSLAAGDTIKLVCIVTHLKAGMNYESSRRASLQVAMDYVNQHYPTDNVLIMGDFNMYSANESGYRLLTQTYSPENIRFVDPLGSVGGVGAWNENSQFAPFHTQSTLSWSENDCRSGGGLDDRFDFILMADEIAFGYNRIRYVGNSYKAVGNDGHHFNQGLDQNGNTSVPPAVLDALVNSSDHLPVTMKLLVDSKLDVADYQDMGWMASLAPNPASDYVDLSFCNPSPGEVQLEVFNLQGQLMARESACFATGQQTHRVDVSALAEGFYLLRMTGKNGRSQTLKLLLNK